MEIHDKSDAGIDLGNALNLVSEQLKMPAMGYHSLRPLLILCSAGQPTDDLVNGIKASMDQPFGMRSVRIAISIGRDANLDVLNSFAVLPELVLNYFSIERLVDCVFSWPALKSIYLRANETARTDRAGPSSRGPSIPPPSLKGDENGIW